MSSHAFALSPKLTTEDDELSFDFIKLFNPSRDVEAEPLFLPSTDPIYNSSVQHTTFSPTTYVPTADQSFNSSFWPTVSTSQQDSLDRSSLLPGIIDGNDGFAYPDVQDINIADNLLTQQDVGSIDPAFLASQTQDISSSPLVRPNDSSSGLIAFQPETHTKDIFGHGNVRAAMSASSLAKPSAGHGQNATENNSGVCQVCGQTLLRRGDLRRHMLQHDDPQFQCKSPGCGKAFRRLDKFRDHVRQVHPKESQEGEESSPNTIYFVCEQCNMSFRRRTDLNRHRYRKHEPRYTCKHCDRSFHLRADLDRHKQSIHIREAGPVRFCPVDSCGFTCVRKDNLTRHVRVKHGLDTARSLANSKST